jgi:hypothetical protein
MRRYCQIILVLAIGLMLPAAAHAAHYGFRGSPEDGGPNSRFVIRFVAPRTTTATTGYRVTVEPRLQSNGGDGTLRGYERALRPGGVKRGQRVGTSLPAIGCAWSAGYRNWCPGLYIATVRFGSRTIGTFQFVVSGHAS